MLDRLGPVERAVFLLADVFALPFAEIAATVGRSEVACRQIASRARRRLRGGPVRGSSGGDRQVVDELLKALALGDVNGVLLRLAPDVVCVTDGGPHRRAARRPVLGAARVARLLVNLSRRYLEGVTVRPVSVNGDPGFVLTLGGIVDSVAAFVIDVDRITAIWVIRNPDKLEHIGQQRLVV
jgi:RNA polymerase sigma-70 factor, ECF subfamily